MSIPWNLGSIFSDPHLLGRLGLGKPRPPKPLTSKPYPFEECLNSIAYLVSKRVYPVEWDLIANQDGQRFCGVLSHTEYENFHIGIDFRSRETRPTLYEPSDSSESIAMAEFESFDAAGMWAKLHFDDGGLVEYGIQRHYCTGNDPVSMMGWLLGILKDPPAFAVRIPAQPIITGISSDDIKELGFSLEK